MNTGTVQIMWKEIIVGFIILYLLRGVLDVYMIKKYEKLLKLFGVIEMDTLKLEAEKHLKLCNFFSVGPWNKAIYWTYKSFVLALYYRSKKDFNQARHYYDVYLTSKHVNNDIGVIMDSVWSGKAKSELVAESVKKFENPVLRKLFAENHIL